MTGPARGRAGGETGAVLAEFGLLLPLLALMAFGVVEFGMAWQDRLTVQAATRAGVRVGSNAGATVDADKSLLVGLGSAINDVGLDNVEWVLVYKSAATDGAVPTACLAPAPHGVSGSCNAYSGAQLKQIVAGSSPASWFGCGVGALDGSWCPSARQTTQAYGTDYLGIWLKASHPMWTGFFGSELTLTDRAVMRLEPK